MEKRKITIVDSQTNSKVEVMTDATTFGELKAAVKNAGINIEDKDWLEGITKTSPRSDESVLPTNVHYVPKRGENAGREIVTNNLVYMLTNVEKKIKSGVDRKEVYTMIKELNFQDAIKEHFGRNYTQVSTENLISFLEATKSKKSAPKKEVKPKSSAVSDSEFASAVVAFIYSLPVSTQSLIIESLSRGANGFSDAEVDEIINSVR